MGLKIVLYCHLTIEYFLLVFINDIVAPLKQEFSSNTQQQNEVLHKVLMNLTEIRSAGGTFFTCEKFLHIYASVSSKRTSTGHSEPTSKTRLQA